MVIGAGGGGWWVYFIRCDSLSPDSTWGLQTNSQPDSALREMYSWPLWGKY